MKKKAQIQMMETVMVLVVFFFIIGIGLVFFGKFQQGAIKQSQTEMFEKRAVDIALKAAYLPELACSHGQDIDYNCVDLGKVLAFSANMDKQKRKDPAYSGFFQFYTSDFTTSRIVLRIIYPKGQPPGQNGDISPYPVFTIYDNAPEMAKKMKSFVPVTVIDPLRTKGKDKLFGVLEIEATQALLENAALQPKTGP